MIDMDDVMTQGIKEHMPTRYHRTPLPAKCFDQIDNIWKLISYNFCYIHIYHIYRDLFK